MKRRYTFKQEYELVYLFNNLSLIAKEFSTNRLEIYVR